DHDGMPDVYDVCPAISDPNQADGDFDGIGNVCDICPTVFNPDQNNGDAHRDGHSVPSSCAGTRDDCNDGDASDFPGNTEICDGRDNNCDNQIEERTNAGGACSTGKLGVCAAGTLSCDAGGSVCHQTVQASAELCDFL